MLNKDKETTDQGSKGPNTTGHNALGEMPEWDLSDLYQGPDDPQLNEDLKCVEQQAKDFQAHYQDRIKTWFDGDNFNAENAGAELARAIAEYENLQDRLGRIATFAQLLYAFDNEDTACAKLYGDIQNKLTAISTHTIFFSLDINRVDDNHLFAALEAVPALTHYKPWIDDLRRERDFQLSDDLEKLFHEKSLTGRGAWSRLFNETMTALRFQIDGEEYSLEPALNFLMSKDGHKRAAAADSLAKVFRDNSRLFCLITNTLANDKAIADQWRGFEDVADSRHLSNRVEREVVDSLVSAVCASYGQISHRYYALKAKWLGLERLEYWDRNAPLPMENDREIPWREAEEMVLKAYRGFDPGMADIAGKFFTENWIDAPLRPGKAQGAFSHPSVPSSHPFVLINYQGKPRDVQTLAHELGHGIHQVLAAKQGALMAPTPLTLAETASVFGEMLTFKSLLGQTEDKMQRKALLAGKVEDMINTVVRQIAFYCFERKVHEGRKEGELTAETLGQYWMEVQGESLGPAINLRPEYASYWSYVPHFIHAPFYVYAYAFGDCLVNSLYAVYENAHEGFAEKYLDMLAAGGTKHHKDLLAPFGLDASDKAFWSKGLSVIEGMIDELEQIE